MKLIMIHSAAQTCPTVLFAPEEPFDMEALGDEFRRERPYDGEGEENTIAEDDRFICWLVCAKGFIHPDFVDYDSPLD